MPTVPTAQAPILATDVPNVDTGGALRLDLRTAPRANADDFAPPASSFINPGLMDAGLNKASEVLGQIQAKDDSLWAQNTALQSRSYWMQKFKDPSYQPTPEQFQQDYTDHQQGLVQNAPTGRASDMLMTQTNEQALPLLGETINMQVKKAQVARASNLQGIANQTVSQASDMPPSPDAIDFVTKNLGTAGIHPADKSGAVGAVYGSWAQNNPKGILAMADPNGAPIELPGMNFKQSQHVIDTATVNAATGDMQGATPDEMASVVQGYSKTASPSVTKALVKSTNSAFSMMVNDPVTYFSGRPEIQQGTQALQQIQSQTQDPSAIADASNRLIEMNLNAQQQARAEKPSLFVDKQGNPLPLSVMSTSDAKNLVAQVGQSKDTTQTLILLNGVNQRFGPYQALAMQQLQKQGLPFGASIANEITEPYIQQNVLDATHKQNENQLEDKVKGKITDAIMGTPEFSQIAEMSRLQDNPLGFQKQFTTLATQYAAMNPQVNSDPQAAGSDAMKKIYSGMFSDVKENGATIPVSNKLNLSPDDLTSLKYGFSTIRTHDGMEGEIMDTNGQLKGLASDGNLFDTMKQGKLAQTTWVPATKAFVPPGQDPSKYFALSYSPDGINTNYIYKDGKPMVMSTDDIIQRGKAVRNNQGQMTPFTMH